MLERDHSIREVTEKMFCASVNSPSLPPSLPPSLSPLSLCRIFKEGGGRHNDSRHVKYFGNEINTIISAGLRGMFLLQVHEPKTKVDLTKYLENHNFQ